MASPLSLSLPLRSAPVVLLAVFGLSVSGFLACGAEDDERPPVTSGGTDNATVGVGGGGGSAGGGGYGYGNGY